MRLPFSLLPTSSTYHHHLFSLSSSLILKLKWAHIMDSTTTARRHHLRKILVIMGPTGSGKSKLSIDLATRFFPASEIINSDKIQVYRGLDITTNKITLPDRLGVTHHLLGEIDSQRSLLPSEFRSLASSYISDISSRRRLPVIVGGSNSLIYALLAKRFDPKADVFTGSYPDPVCPELRYDCCFLWVDVSLPVLNQYLAKRVDEMLDSGMFEELAEFYDSDEFDSVNQSGLRKAIGIPEFERYFERFGCGCSSSTRDANSEEEVTRRVVFEESVKAIKDNTCQLAKRQLGKIQRLRDARWDLRRIDATGTFRAAMGLDTGGGRVADIWERQVLEPSVKIVKRFLEE